MGKFLDEIGLSELWKRIKDRFGFTTDDTLTLKNDVLAVSTPVNNRSLTQEEFDALPEEKRSHGFYIVRTKGSSLEGLEIEEYDTDIETCDWHVVKWSNGRCEMFGTVYLDILPSDWVSFGTAYIVSSSNFPRYNYPVPLVKRYYEMISIDNGSGVTAINYGANETPLKKTNSYGLLRPVLPSNANHAAVHFSVMGRWK